MPAFSAPAVLGMFDDMEDIVSQLVTKWERSVHLCLFLVEGL